MGCVVQAAGRPESAAGAVPGGRVGAPGPRGADGGAVGAAGGSQRAGGPALDSPVAQSATAFDRVVEPGGYAWWYLDALSDDGEQGLTVIAFIGSVFSPYYARARRRAPGEQADPQNHCAVNVVQYGAQPAWTMTERGRTRLHRDAQRLQIGSSEWRWQGDQLQLAIDEVTVPWPRAVRGHVTVQVPQRLDHVVELTPGHHWCPIAPRARVEVELGGVGWRGWGYLDSNHGDRPLERSFRRWDWSRAHCPGGGSAVFYDVEAIGCAPRSIGLGFDDDGGVSAIGSLPSTQMPSSRWGIARHARSDAASPPQVVRCLTDAPFYARSLLKARWHGESVEVMHESLSLTRFDTAWVQAMLPFRMPRRSG